MWPCTIWSSLGHRLGSIKTRTLEWGMVYVCLIVCIHACIYMCVSLYACMYVCMYVCMYTCMYVYMYVIVSCLNTVFFFFF